MLVWSVCDFKLQVWWSLPLVSGVLVGIWEFCGLCLVIDALRQISPSVEY